MRISRLHLPVISTDILDSLSINNEKAHYIRNVLRLKIGHELIFFTTDGKEFHSVISEIQRHNVILSNIKPTENPTQQSAIDITIIQAISAGDRMDYTVQKSAEMGVNTLIPVFSQYCNQKIPADKYVKKQSHWQAVANSACEQSGRCDLLTIEPITDLNNNLISDHPVGIYLEPTVSDKICDLPKSHRKQMSIFIGPEGGFSESEIQAFKTAGLMGVQLGQRILRTETAAPVVLAAIHTLFGDFS